VSIDSRVVRALLALAVLGAVFWLGVEVGRDRGERSVPDQVLDLLRTEYYRPVDAPALETASVQDMLKRLHDPYTAYLDPQALAELQRDNEGVYTGVGIRVGRRGARVVISGVFAGGPAARAGVRPGDLILSVDGARVTSATADRVIGRIKGPEGTTVRLVLHRPGAAAPIDLALERRAIHVPVVAGRTVTVDGRKVGYVALSQFTRGSGKELGRAVRARLGAGARAIVLDLRGDPGGLLDEAVSAASVFLREGTPVVTTEGAHSARRTLRAGSGAIPGRVPLVVLVDRSSASASEVVAGALRDDGRGTLVGERTFGKALVQSTVELDGGGALKLTTARYLTPKGLDINRRGLAPSVRAADDPHTRRDEALDRALAVAAAASRR
jgi:carboxyl-terminal processing protease